MANEEEESGGKVKLILVALLIVVLSGGLIWFVNIMLATPIEPPKKTVQEIKIIRPPPPPPEVEEEPPPPPEEEEVDIPEPEEDIPDLPDMEPPPGSQLGLDAEGGAGGDAFGLLGKKGGRSLIGSGSGDRFKWYSNIVVSELLDKLNENERLRKKSYRVNFKIWLGKSGNITRFELLNSTGDSELDSNIRSSLSSITRISEAPPADLKMPITLGMRSR